MNTIKTRVSSFKSQVFSLICLAFAATAAVGQGSALYDPHLTPGENVIAQINEVASHPVEYADAATTSSAPVTINANSNGTVTIDTPAGAIPAPALTNSYTNTTIEVDAGVLTLGVGSTVHVSSYLQGFYVINNTFEAGLISEWGAVNTLDALSGALHVRHIFNDNFMGYAGPEAGYDFANREPRGGADIGVRWVPASQLMPNLAMHAEFVGLYERGSGKNIGTGWKAGLSYRW